MKLSEEMAIRLHRMMWRDMQRELGDDPEGDLRHSFKIGWIKKHFPGEYIENQCFLCEYVKQLTGQNVTVNCVGCRACPIKWPKNICCNSGFTIAPVHFLNSPIHDILELATRHADPDVLWNYEQEALEKANGYLKFREEKLSEYSGLPGSSAIDDHVKKIQEKVRDNTRNDLVKELAEISGLPVFVDIWRHIKAIQEKAVDEYFEKTPGAKLATMDVDDAFKQYAKEQMEPLKQMNDRLTKRHIAVKDYLAKQSGLDHDRPVGDHIKKIRDDAFSDGENAERERIQEKIEEMLNK